MNNYNKILEAVNRGIKFALDDFEDNELQSQTNSKIKYQSGTKEWIDLMEEVVDLGLPSGTLWCKYNLGVDSTQLTEPKDWYGDYYAWGEIKPKQKFNWFHYKFGNDYDELFKYCDNPEYGLHSFTDNLTELLPEDDVVYQTKKLHNFKFRIPTKEQFNELIKYANNYWVNNYDPNKNIHTSEDDGGIQGLNGRIFEGKTGNQIFIPVGGRYTSSGKYGGGSYCYLWTSSLDLPHPDYAYFLYFDSDRICMGSEFRCYGCSVRPVINL